MNYTVLCKDCGASAVVQGEYEPDTDALVLEPNAETEWLGGILACLHEDLTVLEEEQYEGMQD